MKKIEFTLNKRHVEIDISRMWAFIVIDGFIYIDYNYCQFEFDEIFFKHKEKNYVVYDCNNGLNEKNYKLINSILNCDIFNLIENDLKIHELPFNNYDILKKSIETLGA